MASYNKTTIIGNVVAEPEYKDKGVVRFRMATDQYDGKDAEGKPKYKSVFWNCVSFSKTEYFTKFIGKGTQVFVEAEMTQDEYLGNNGEKKIRYELRVFSIIALQRAKNTEGVQVTTEANRTQQTQNNTQINANVPPLPPIVEQNRDLFGQQVSTDDLPF